MTQPSFPPKPRSPLPFILGGCAFIFLCLTTALAANAVYWTVRTRAPSADAAPPQSTGSIRELVESLPQGSSSSGETVFVEHGCQGCHSLTANGRGAGPSLSGVSTRAAEIKPGYSAKMYLYEAIVDPGAHTVSGYPAGVMPSNYRRSLSDQQLADLLAFLLTQ